MERSEKPRKRSGWFWPLIALITVLLAGNLFGGCRDLRSDYDSYLQSRINRSIDAREDRITLCAVEGNEYRIGFEHGGASLDARDVETLTTISNILNRCPRGKAQVYTYADRSGESTRNQDLARARAKMIELFLQSKGAHVYDLELFPFSENLESSESRDKDAQRENRTAVIRLRVEPLSSNIEDQR